MRQRSSPKPAHSEREVASFKRKSLARQRSVPDRIRIFVVDDHEVVRIGLQSLLRLARGMEVVGEASTKTDALDKIRSLTPDLVLMDIRLPDGSGVDACREIRALSPQTRILFLTSYSDDETVLAAILSGAHGYILKEINTKSLLQAIRTVAAGHSLLHPEVTKRTIQWLRLLADPERQPEAPHLSDRERRILVLLSEGKTNKEIAAALELSDKTVKNYLANAYEKLRVSRRSEAAAVFSRKYK